MQTLYAHLHNPGSAPVLETKLTLLKQDGSHILPAYYSDNYVALMPGESRDVAIDYPAYKAQPVIGIRGWNVKGQRIQ